MSGKLKKHIFRTIESMTLTSQWGETGRIHVREGKSLQSNWQRVEKRIRIRKIHLN